MRKGFFLGFPSVSVCKTLLPVIDEIASCDYEIIYYNAGHFMPAGDHHFSFRAYPDCFEAYVSDRMNERISYFQFGSILMDIAGELTDFLLTETEKEKPDFIIFSHLAVWGKLIARHFKVPVVTLYSTFILDKRIMLPYFRKLNAGGRQDSGHIHDAMHFYRKSRSLYNRLQLNYEPDLWDVYINKGDLNLSFILSEFQPQKELIDPDYAFVGYPVNAEEKASGLEAPATEKKLIYIAMGTVLNKEITFYHLCINVLKKLRADSVISTGSKVETGAFGEVPGHIRIAQFVDQRAVLKEAALFISRGGMASVHEAIYSLTPMIVIPVIPEQQLTGEKIQALGIGRVIPVSELTETVLQAAIVDILNNRAWYIENLKKLSLSIPSSSPQRTACRLINDFLKRTVVHLFIKQAEKKPDSIAVRYKQEGLTYKELNEKSNQLAHYLQKKGVTKEAIVPVFIEPGIDAVIAIWGIMKAGGAYVPIDPEYPVERVAFMLEDTACRIVISCKTHAEKLSPQGKYLVVQIDQHWPLIAAEPVTVPNGLPGPNNLSYIIYTSGSTGRPKGVMVEHAQILAYTLDVYERMELKGCAHYAILGTFAADAGLTAFFSAFCFGKDLSIINVKDFPGFRALASHMQQLEIDCYKTTPSLMELFLKNEEAARIIPARRLLLGGEACPRPLAVAVKKLLPAGCLFFNHYGPTETTVGVITFQFPDELNKWPEVIPLGIPLNRVGVYILRDDKQPADKGEPGELHIEGPLVARGYLNDLTITAQKFINITIAGNQKRLYSTGDLVRMWPDGNIEFLGRMDDQVKIHGYRIELKEIENTLLLSELVKQCVVLAKENKQGEKYLAGYIIPANKFNKDELIHHLKQKLPAYMIPVRWVVLKEWPLTFNNKINKLALPDPESEYQELRERRDATTGDMESRLIGIWRQLLGEEYITPADNFFERGGDSLRLIRLSFEIGAQLQIEISPVELFSCLTLEKMAACLGLKEKSLPVTEDNNKVLTGFDADEASAVQKRFFLRSRLNPSECFPNSSVTYSITGEIDKNKLENAFHQVISIHEMLRTVFVLREGKVYKRIAAADFSLDYLRSDKLDIDAEIIAYTKPFDLSRATLIRACVIELKDSSKYLHVYLPHINSDGESLTVIMNDLKALYNNTYKERKRLQFTDFQKSQHNYLNAVQRSIDEEYWRQQFCIGISSYILSYAGRHPRALKFDGVSTVDRFPEALYERIDQYILGKHLTKFQLLLSAYIYLLHKITAAENIAVMVPVHNRHEAGFEDIVGLVSNVIPVKICIQKEWSVADLVDNCRDIILGSMGHQRFPLEEIRRLWTSAGKNIRHFCNAYFGYQDSKHEYAFGDALLKLHIGSGNKERLPLSAAVFQVKSGLMIRLSSSDAIYNKHELQSFIDLYYSILEQIVTGNHTVPVKSAYLSK